MRAGTYSAGGSVVYCVGDPFQRNGATWYGVTRADLSRLCGAESVSAWPSYTHAEQAAKAYARAERSAPRLKREAASAAKSRGHRVAWGEVRGSSSRPWRSVILGACRKCGAEVAVDTYPDPNGITVGGEAVALTCPAKAGK